MKHLVRIIVLISVVLFSAAVSFADEKKLEVNQPDSIRVSLETYVGSTVTLRLLAGEDVSGTVKTVGKNAVQLTQLTGKEYFDALIPLERIQALIVRTQK